MRILPLMHCLLNACRGGLSRAVAPFVSLLFVLVATAGLAACGDATATRTPQSIEDERFPPITPIAASNEPEPGAPPSRLGAGLDQVGYSDTLRFDSMLLGGYRVIFGRTTLTDTARYFGAGERREHGGGGDYEAWLCYTVPNEQRVWLVSNEIGGGEFITDVRAELDPQIEANDDCPVLPSRFRRVTLDPALWLGANVTQIERRFGDAPALDEWRSYTNAVGQTRNNLSFTDNFTLSLKIENNTVVAMNLSKTTISREGL